MNTTSRDKIHFLLSLQGIKNQVMNPLLKRIPFLIFLFFMFFFEMKKNSFFDLFLCHVFFLYIQVSHISFVCFFFMCKKTFVMFFSISLFELLLPTIYIYIYRRFLFFFFIFRNIPFSIMLLF